MKHKLATFFLWLAHELEPDWIEGILKIKEGKPLEEKQSLFDEPPPK